MKNYIFLNLMFFFSTISVQAGAFVKVGRQLTRPTTVTHPITPTVHVPTYRYRYAYTYPYAGVALSSYNSLNTLNTLNTYHSQPDDDPIWPDVLIGVGILFLVYLAYSGFNEKVQIPYTYSRNAEQNICYPNLVHTHSVELANGGGILVR